MNEKDLDQLLEEFYPTLLLYGISLTRLKSDICLNEPIFRQLLM